jgi:predicted AlkP superfamily pyrophosphatase or phosphodiesterase
MVTVEVGDALRHSDQALGNLVDLLNRTVGRNKWAMAVTADHGQTPLPQTVGAWPIDINELERDVARRFGVDADELFQRSRPGAMWLDDATLERNGHTLNDVARYLLQYPARDNLVVDQKVAGGYEARLSERLFASVFPYAWMPLVWRCAQDRASRE